MKQVKSFFPRITVLSKRHCRYALALTVLAAAFSVSVSCNSRKSAGIQNVSGVRLRVADEDNAPVLRVVLPGEPKTERAFRILFPEHVTARQQGHADGEHLYVFRPGRSGDRPAWRQSANSLEYEREFGGIHFLARAILEDDGLHVHYEFVNRSNLNYEMIYAVTDPRLIGIFHDVRLERTYIHHKEGFDLLASETPERLTLPLNRWLPLRYVASFTWPVASQRVERQDDGITRYNKSRAVDQPMIATLSSDRQWVVTSFTRTTGNVWSNPELTCQHVDPQTALAPGQSATLELKILIFQGSLDAALEKVMAQRNTLK